MIYCQCNFFSKTLKSHVPVEVLLPALSDWDCLKADLDEIYPAGRRWPVLYLLHGALDDATSWIRETGIERYAAQKGVAVVMPNGQNGFYANAKYGLPYFDFITQELPRFIESTFPVSKRGCDRFIAGPSMGGYGAAKCALTYPDRYAAFGNLSGAVDPGELEPRLEKMGVNFIRYDLIFGGSDKVAGSDDDLYLLAERQRDAKKKPKAFFYCALEDGPNYDMNVRLKNALDAAGFATVFADGHGGHGWAYWDTCLADFVKNLPLSAN